jgi:hypothetical protein
MEMTSKEIVEGKIKEDVLKNEKLNNPSKNCFTVFIHVKY